MYLGLLQNTVLYCSQLIELGRTTYSVQPYNVQHSWTKLQGTRYTSMEH